MTPEEIVELARRRLKRMRTNVVRAAGKKWQLECLERLQAVTGLKLSPPTTNCEVGFLAIAERRPDFSFPTRELWKKAESLAATEEDLDAASKKLVDFFLDDLPACRREEEAETGSGVLDTLGSYCSEKGVIGGRAELYWARIINACRKPGKLSIGPLARVVMLHELAHYVTHQGYDSRDQRHWVYFPGRPQVVEVVAQAATQQVIEDTKDAPLRAAFDTLLTKQTEEYTAYSKIREMLEKEFKSSKDEGSRALADFWIFFWARIRNAQECKTLNAIYAMIHLKRASDDVGTNLDI
jgi:head-tail adaptor